MSEVIVYQPSNRHDWLNVRRGDVTASQVGALFACHPFTSPFRLWHEKAGNLPPVEENDAMLRGTLLEPVAVELLRRRHPDWKIIYSTEAMTYFQDREARLGATPDVLAFDPARGWGNIQIKTLSARDFETKWRDEDGEPDPPLWISLQTELERDLVNRSSGLIELNPRKTPVSWSAAAAMTLGSHASLDLHLVDVPSVPGLVDTMARKSLAFWASVESGEEPEPDYRTDAGTIAEAYAEDEEGAIDLTSDADIEALIATRDNLLASRRTINESVRAIDAEIQHRLGEAPVAYLADGRTISWRTERREGRFMPPTEGRRLRLPKPKRN